LPACLAANFFLVRHQGGVKAHPSQLERVAHVACDKGVKEGRQASCSKCFLQSLCLIRNCLGCGRAVAACSCQPDHEPELQWSVDHLDIVGLRKQRSDGEQDRDNGEVVLPICVSYACTPAPYFSFLRCAFLLNGFFLAPPIFSEQHCISVVDSTQQPMTSRPLQVSLYTIPPPNTYLNVPH